MVDDDVNGDNDADSVLGIGLLLAAVWIMRWRLLISLMVGRNELQRRRKGAEVRAAAAAITETSSNVLRDSTPYPHPKRCLSFHIYTFAPYVFC